VKAQQINKKPKTKDSKMKNQIKTQSAVTGLKINTSIKSGHLASNHNQALVRG